MNLKLLLVSLVLIILVAGCIQPNGATVECGTDNVLELEFDKEGEIRTLPGYPVKIIIYLKNPFECGKGGEIIRAVDVNEVNLRVSDTFGLQLLESQSNCGSKGNIEGTGCHFEKIEGGEIEEIIFFFRAPSRDEIANIGQELKPEFTLEYLYSGQSVFSIPIVKHGESVSASKDLSQKRGPVKADIYMGGTLEEETEDFIRQGNPVSIKVKVEDKLLRSESNVKIEKKSFNLTLDNFVFDEKFEELGHCDFERDGTIFKPTTGEITDEITLPMEEPMKCVFKAVDLEDSDPPWVPGTITTDFLYTYKFTTTKTVKIITRLG